MNKPRAVEARIGAIGHQVIFDALGRTEGDTDAARIPVRIVAIFVPDHVMGIAVAIMIGANDADEQLVLDHGHVDDALNLLGVIIAIFRKQRSGKVVRRLMRHEKDRATSRVTAEQRALRAGEHLKIFKIDEVAGSTLLAERDRRR